MRGLRIAYARCAHSTCAVRAYNVLRSPRNTILRASRKKHLRDYPLASDENIVVEFGGIKNYTYICEKYIPMPTLLIAFGIRYYFYLDEHQPIHVHVDCNGRKAKIELMPEIRIVYNHGLKEQEVKRTLNTCQAYRLEFISEWYKRFGK